MENQEVHLFINGCWDAGGFHNFCTSSFTSQNMLHKDFKLCIKCHNMHSTNYDTYVHYMHTTASEPYHHNRFTALFPGPPGWAGARRELLDFMVQGRLTEADTLTIWLGATSSGLTSAYLHHPPTFFTGRMPFCKGLIILVYFACRSRWITAVVPHFLLSSGGTAYCWMSTRNWSFTYWLLNGVTSEEVFQLKFSLKYIEWEEMV